MPTLEATSGLEFRDPARARDLAAALSQTVTSIGRTVSVMHVCGSHEQAIAKFGLRASFPRGLNVIMGPGCPVCITDMPEIDEAVALALQGVRIATYGDMLRVPGTAGSLGDAHAAGARIEVVYSVTQAVDLARSTTEPVVFFATGFETTAVATAAVILAGPPDNADRTPPQCRQPLGRPRLVAPRRRRGVRLLFFQAATIPRYARGRLIDCPGG